MSRAIGTALTLALITSLVCAQDADLEKAVQEATKAGNLAEAKRLCDRWAKAKPQDEQPHLILGRLYAKQELIDKALEAFETAREVNPLNPEPACEVGKLFLLAGMGDEAIAEFKAALKVRKNYLPAVKGLAEAEALLANPYAKGVYAKLGEPNEERGLKQLASDETRVATIGGRQCRATNKDGKRYFLNFDIADEYLCDVDVPIRVTIEYYDLGTGKFDFRYDSTDTSALDLGVRKTPPPIRRTNSKTWKTITFNLPDAKLANRSWWNADMTISSLAWESGEDVYVSSVRVIRGGLAVSAEPAVAVADDTSFCAVTARVFDAMGPAADGTVVRFTTNLGTIEPEVKTVDGQAKAVLRPGAEPGEATITVQAGEDQRVLYVPVLAGRGKIVRRALVLDRLDQDLGWRSEGFRGGLGTFQPAPDEHREGRPSMRIAYRLRPNLSTSLISFRRSISVPGRPVKLGLWVKMDGSRSRVQVALMDATGQTLVFRLGYIESEGWHWMEHDIGDPVYIRGGASDGRVHLPARFDALQIGRYYGAPGKARGEICVQDLTVVTEVPESAATTVTMEADLARPDKSFGPVYYMPRPAAFRVGLTYLGNEAKLGRLCWTVTDDGDEVVARGESDQLAIAAGSHSSIPVTAALSVPGAYRAQFSLEIDGQAEQAPEVMRFLALRHMPHSNLAVEIQRRGKDMAVRLDNRTDKAMEFTLSYRLLNAPHEVLSKGMPDEPKMKMEPGEVLDVSISLKGLMPGRYLALLLLDMAGGDRFTRLLPFDVYPDVLTMPVKIVAEDDSPIRNASVGARLVQYAHSSRVDRGSTLQEWDVRTDETGLCELTDLRVPGDPDRCRVHLDVVAAGFADMQRVVRLSSLVSIDGSPRPAYPMRLTRGVSFSGRVVGADGQPVSNARIAAMGLVKKGRRTPRIHWYRPRTTDGDGRFELMIRPDTETQLTAQSAQWAPKRIIVPAGKPVPGDIQLEKGAVITGTFVDEKGKPAAGYWVTAETTDHGPSSVVVDPVTVAAKTGADGTFALPPLKGRCVISTPASFQLWTIGSYRHSPQPRVVALPQTLTVDRDDVELELRAARQVRIAGRVLNADRTMARNVTLYLGYSKPSTRVMQDRAVTDDNGRYAFEGIPSGPSSITVRASGLRTWDRKKRIYLRAKPITHPEWQIGPELNRAAMQLEDIDKDVLDLDFQYCFWSSKHGFLDTSPDGQPVPRRKQGALSKLADAFKRLTNTASLSGRVLDAPGNGLRGAQVRIEIVRRVDDDEKGKEQVIGSWTVKADADGKFALPAVPMPPPEQYRVRVQIVADGHVEMQKAFPLNELVKPGTRALRIPDLRLEIQDRE